jgi:hypothetical protein
MFQEVSSRSVRTFGIRQTYKAFPFFSKNYIIDDSVIEKLALQDLKRSCLKQNNSIWLNWMNPPMPQFENYYKVKLQFLQILYRMACIPAVHWKPTWYSGLQDLQKSE